MKKEIYLSFILIVSMLMACKKEGLKLYDNAASKSSIYFPMAERSNDTLLSFGYAKTYVRDSVIKLVVRAIGAPETVDRPYQLNVADSSTLKKGLDYEFLNKAFAIKAGQVTDTISIKVYRNVAMGSDSLFLYMDLQPNANFTNSFLSREVNAGGKLVTKYYTRMRLKVDDIAGPPAWWIPGSIYYSPTFSQFGKFSTLKFQLILTRYNLNIDELIKPNWFAIDGNSRKIFGYASGLKAYLNQMVAMGTPVYEADRITLMTMGIGAK